MYNIQKEISALLNLKFNFGKYGIWYHFSEYKFKRIYITVPSSSELKKDGKEMAGKEAVMFAVKLIIESFYEDNYDKELIRKYIKSEFKFLYKENGIFTKEKSEKFQKEFKANIKNEIEYIKTIIENIRS